MLRQCKCGDQFRQQQSETVLRRKIWWSSEEQCHVLMVLKLEEGKQKKVLFFCFFFLSKPIIGQSVLSVTKKKKEKDHLVFHQLCSTYSSSYCHFLALQRIQYFLFHSFQNRTIRTVETKIIQLHSTVSSIRTSWYCTKQQHSHGLACCLQSCVLNSKNHIALFKQNATQHEPQDEKNR